MATEMMPPKKNSGLGFINLGLTLCGDSYAFGEISEIKHR
jgi:hypothetical protein